VKSKTIITIFLLCSLILLTACQKETQNKQEVCFQDVCYEVEIPKTQQEFTQGLMYREYLPENQGMLFIFQETQKHGFWMKNTLIPLDIIWMNEELEVVYIAQAVPCEEEPCTIYAPDTEALYVLEINQNQTIKNNINIGDKAQLKI
jgi:uncharacterized protein